MRPTRGEVANLLFATIPELNPPDMVPNQLHGLRALRAVGRDLKLIYGLRSLQPLAEHGADAIAAALTLVTEILSALGAFLSRNPDTSLTDLRAAAVATLLDLPPGHEPVPDADVENFQSPQVVLLEAADMAQLRRAGSAGTSAEIVRGAARMVLELWEFADQLRRSPAGRAGELIHVRCWGSPATAKVLRVLGLEGARDDLPQPIIVCERAEQPVTVD